MGDPPFSAAPLELVEIASRCMDILQFAVACLLMNGPEIRFDVRLLAIDPDYDVGDMMHGAFHGVEQRDHFPYPVIGIEGRLVRHCVIIECIGPESGTQKVSIAAVDSPAIPVEAIPDGLAIGELFEKFSMGRNPRKRIYGLGILGHVLMVNCAARLFKIAEVAIRVRQ